MLTQYQIFTALSSEHTDNPFVLDFDEIWETFGYGRKSDIKRYLLERAGLHQVILDNNRENTVRQLPQDTVNLLGYVETDDGKVFLSLTSFKFALPRANPQAGEEYLLHLLEVEQEYITSLERRLSSPVDHPDLVDSSQYFLEENRELQQEIQSLKEEIQRLEDLNQTHLQSAKSLAAQLDRTEGQLISLNNFKVQMDELKYANFDYDLDTLQDISGIADRKYLVRILVDNFVLWEDFTTVNPEKLTGRNSPRVPKTKYYMTRAVWNCLVVSLRSLKGVAISELDDFLVIDRDLFFKEKENIKKMNSRFPKRR